MKQPSSGKIRRFGIGADRSFDDVLQSQEYPSDFRVRQLAGLTTGRDSGLVEHLVSDPITDTCCETLVQQQGFDRGRPPGKQCRELSERG